MKKEALHSKFEVKTANELKLLKPKNSPKNEINHGSAKKMQIGKPSAEKSPTKPQS